MSLQFTRRACLCLLAAGSTGVFAQQQPASDASDLKDWVCPMDPDYRADKPGVCPRCGMKLVLSVPERVEYPLEISQSPQLLKPGDTVTLTMRAIDPQTGKNATHFEIVHEKLVHLFVVGEDLSFFRHIHPELQPDGSFVQKVQLPNGGMYRLLADFYPSGSVPQLALGTIFVSGDCAKEHLESSLVPYHAENVTASLRLDPAEPLAGLETKLFFTLDPAAGLEPYLGAWAHMLAASEDLIDLIHLHPFIATGDANMQFNVIFPRAGLYRIWTQIQRAEVVNTIVFTVPVKEL